MLEFFEDFSYIQWSGILIPILYVRVHTVSITYKVIREPGETDPLRKLGSKKNLVALFI
jgi:hypothetical protein